MSTYAGRTHFRSHKRRHVFSYGLLCLCSIIVAAAYVIEGLTWITGLIALMLPIGVAAVIESHTDYLVIHDRAIELRRTFRRSSVDLESIASISNEKGCPVLIVLEDGNKVEVPDLGVSGIANSLRAWLRAAEKPAAK